VLLLLVRKPEDPTAMYEIFWRISNTLTKDIEFNPEGTKKQKELLKHMRKTGDFFKKIILDDSNNPVYRKSALTALMQMNPPEIIDFTFKLLGTMKCPKFKEKGKKEEFISNFDWFFESIESLIVSYSKFNLIDCRKRLWKAHEIQKR